LADSTPGVYFVGRLATYKYYNMDQVAAQALSTYAKICGERRAESNLRMAQKALPGGNGHKGLPVAATT